MMDGPDDTREGGGFTDDPVNEQHPVLGDERDDDPCGEPDEPPEPAEDDQSL
jgi:hypothetical protein